MLNKSRRHSPPNLNLSNPHCCPVFFSKFYNCFQWKLQLLPLLEIIELVAVHKHAF